MVLSQGRLGLLFFLGVALGICLGLLYDFLAFSRALSRVPRPKHPRVCSLGGQILLFGQDLAFAVLSCWSLVILLYYTNDGVFRLLAVCGMACGFLLYRRTLGKWIHPVIPRAAAGARSGIRMILTILALPLLLVGRLLSVLWRATAGKYAASRRRARTKRNVEEQIRLAARGFDLPGIPPTQDSPRE